MLKSYLNNAAWHPTRPPWISLLLTWCLLVFIYPLTGWDEKITNVYFNSREFYLKHDVFLVQVMHTGLKAAIFAIFFSLVLLWLTSFVHQRLAKIRTQLLWAWVGMLLSTMTISMVKHLSIHSCPDKLMLYHGTKPIFSLAETFMQNPLAGHCWPGGHASAGISLLAIYFAFRKSHPDFSIIIFTLSLLLWFLMGWAQIMRGLHFLSHNLWTIWIVWFVLELQLAVWPLTTIVKQNQHA